MSDSNEVGSLSPVTVGVWLLLAVAWALLSAGVFLLLTSRRRRPSLSERLKPYHVRRIGDEVQEWLRDQ